MMQYSAFSNAIHNLAPSGGVSIVGERIYDNIIWNQTDVAPTKAVFEAEVSRLQAEYEAQAYARSRSAEYPPITDYLDGVVKGDQAQIDAYIAACQAVKAKYPKV